MMSGRSSDKGMPWTATNSSYALFAVVGITACISSVAGSIITVYISRRRHRTRDGADDKKYDRRISTMTRDSIDRGSICSTGEHTYTSSMKRLSSIEGDKHTHFRDDLESYITGEREQETLAAVRAVFLLGNRLMEAHDEASCFDEVTKLLAHLFDVDRVSFCMLTDSEHFLIKRVNVMKRDDTNPSASFELEHLVSDYQRPLKDTAVGVCIATQTQHYTPRTEDSEFDTHKVAKQLNSINTVLVTPILVSGNKAAGAIILRREEEDGFKKPDRVLISDIAMMLGQNLYAKRLLKETEESKKRSREMLNSMIPSKVLDKIECYWDNSSEEYKKTRSESLDTSNTTKSSTFSSQEKSNAWYVAADAWSEEDKPQAPPSSPIKEKIKLIRDINRADDDIHGDNVGVLVSTTPRIDFTPISRALYAENVKNVCIIFSDIVGFSRMSMNLSPSSVMDMLQNLFNRFDDLCDLHQVLKLETIGDGYICATNLLDDHDDSIENSQDAAVRALSMAKDMINEAICVNVPSPESSADPLVSTDFVTTLQIRVGIHVGDVTCGVLGQRMPKFTTCGKAVNMAARMEQTSSPSCIRVTKEFHDLVGDRETGWNEKELTVLKNMGEKETYLLDPEEC